MISNLRSKHAVRTVREDDAQTVQALIFSVLEEYALKSDPVDTDKDLFNLSKFYAPPNGYFGVAENSAGKIVATLGLLKLDSHTCELRKMYALPSERGKGLGKLLLESSIERARQWGCKRLVLETASVLAEAVGLYQRYGFKQYYPPDITCRCDMAMELYL